MKWWCIGEDTLYEGTKYHIQDVDNLCQSANIGIPDENGIIEKTIWVLWERLEEVANERNV